MSKKELPGPPQRPPPVNPGQLPCIPSDPAHNGSNSTSGGASDCSDTIPTSGELFSHLPVGGFVLFAILALFTILTIAIYIDEIRFILKTFRKGTRKQKTVWILAVFPVFSTTALLGCLVPRSGTLCDMVAAVFFSTCLFNFGRLMVTYMGGARRMWAMIEDDRPVQLNTPPCCCCCVCLPRPTFKRKMYAKITILIMQVAIVRPILMFLAAVLWTNGSYHPGDMSAYNGFLYVTIINLLSSCAATYGLMVLRGILAPELEKQFAITGKIASVQLVLLFSAIPNVFISILVSTDAIKCNPLFPSKARGEGMYHCFLILMMLPLGILGRKFFRRESDGEAFAEPQPGRKLNVNPVIELESGEEQEIVTQQPNNNDNIIHVQLTAQATGGYAMMKPGLPGYGELRV